MNSNSQGEVKFLGMMVAAFFAVALFGGVLVFFQPEGVVLVENEKVEPVKLERTKKVRIRSKTSPTLLAKENSASDKSPVKTTLVPSSSGNSQGIDGTNKVILSNAVELIDIGKPAEAQSILEELLAKDPTNEEALMELGMIHLIDFNSPRKALDYLERVLKVNPDNKIAVSELVGIYMDTDMNDAGINFLRAVHEKEPQSTSVSMGLGQLLLGQDNYSDAIPYLETAIQDTSENWGYVVTQLADAYRESGQPEKALDLYKTTIDREIDELETADIPAGDRSIQQEKVGVLQIDMAKELIRQKRYKEAEAYLRKAEKNIPGDESIFALFDQIKRKKKG